MAAAATTETTLEAMATTIGCLATVVVGMTATAAEKAVIGMALHRQMIAIVDGFKTCCCYGPYSVSGARTM